MEEATTDFICMIPNCFCLSAKTQMTQILSSSLTRHSQNLAKSTYDRPETNVWVCVSFAELRLDNLWAQFGWLSSSSMTSVSSLVPCGQQS